jgi:Nicotinate phosphoribosyltransferase C-terminal domain
VYEQDGRPLLDLMQNADAPAPAPGAAVLCRHPFEATKRAMVTPSRVELLHKLVSNDSLH